MILLAPGAKVGRFQVVRILGQGSMGVVYLATDPTIERPIALKTLRWEGAGEDADRQVIEDRFLREARLAGRLQHPNIVTIYDVGLARDISFIAMEYVDGEPLTNIVGADVPLEWGVGIVRQAAEALGHAHERDVLHRDVKPGNILLSKEGRPKVTDFGVGKFLTAATSDLAQEGLLYGSPAYSSPEQIRGQKLDGRSDLFSLAVVFYELLTGARPFAGDSVTKVSYLILNSQPRDPRELRPELPLVARDVFFRLLGKSPEERPASAAEFIREIERITGSRKLPGTARAVAAAGSDEWRTQRKPALAPGEAPAAAADTVEVPELLGEPLPDRRVLRRSLVDWWRTQGTRRRFLLAAMGSLAAILLLLILQQARSTSETKGKAGVGREVQQRSLDPAARPAQESAAGGGATTGSVRPTMEAPVGSRPLSGRGTEIERIYRTRRYARFAVTPQQARIYVDGRYVGIADDWDNWGGGCAFPFARTGPHPVRLELSGYRSLNLDVRVTRDAAAETVEVDDTLELRSEVAYPKLPKVAGRTTGAVEFAVEPSDAVVWLGGKRLDAASAFTSGKPLLLSGPKVYDLKLSAPGRKSKTVRILVAPNAGRSRARVKLKLRRR